MTDKLRLERFHFGTVGDLVGEGATPEELHRRAANVLPGPTKKITPRTAATPQKETTAMKFTHASVKAAASATKNAAPAPRKHADNYGVLLEASNGAQDLLDRSNAAIDRETLAGALFSYADKMTDAEVAYCKRPGKATEALAFIRNVVSKRRGAPLAPELSGGIDAREAAFVDASMGMRAAAAKTFTKLPDGRTAFSHAAGTGNGVRKGR